LAPRGNIWEPPIGYVINVAIALGVEPREICEPEWVEPFKYSKVKGSPQMRSAERVKKLKLEPGKFRRRA
jgi:hypothetical protein